MELLLIFCSTKWRINKFECRNRYYTLVMPPRMVGDTLVLCLWGQHWLQSPLLGGCKHTVAHFKCSNKEVCLITLFSTVVAERQETDPNPLKSTCFTLMFTNTASVGSFIFKGPRETDGVRTVQNGLNLNFTTGTNQMEAVFGLARLFLSTYSMYVFVTKHLFVQLQSV